MIALPQPPAHLLTVGEYAQLGEATTGYTELQEGSLVISPSSSPRHMIASGRLLLQVQSQLPDELCAVQEVDIDVELAPADQPGVGAVDTGNDAGRDAARMVRMLHRLLGRGAGPTTGSRLRTALDLVRPLNTGLHLFGGAITGVVRCRAGGTGVDRGGG